MNSLSKNLAALVALLAVFTLAHHEKRYEKTPSLPSCRLRRAGSGG
ncbi:MAG TPA: hypothetical protein P5555_18395 [Candidatus Paceibacterota bacterium]|nr:hypothetical protein [Verrucomicrobiota bacterium]HRZ47154.1 hypothetical protein [Candidatus Paceibacterota bacterium]